MSTCASLNNHEKMSASLCDEMNMEKKSGLFRELNSIPVVKSATSFVSSVRKQSRILNTGMAIVEYSVASVVDRLYGSFSFTSKIDTAGEKGIATLKEKYPVVTQSPDEDTISTSMRKTVRMAMKTPPGRLVVCGLDWAIQKLSYGLKQLDQTKPKQSPTMKNRPERVKEEHAYASEDSGTCETDIISHKDPHSALSSLTEEDTLMSKAYKLGILYPAEKLLSVLKCSRKYVAGSRRLDKRNLNGGDPSGASTGGRTIKSPRKRVQTTIWSRMKTTALKLLGARLDSRLLNIMFYSSSKDPVSPGRAERKRTHDEILTDEGSVSSDGESAHDFDIDLDNYDSEEDPDYEPKEQDLARESDDSSEGETESDLDEVMDEAKTLMVTKKREPKKGDDLSKGKNLQNETKDGSKGANSPNTNKLPADSVATPKDGKKGKKQDKSEKSTPESGKNAQQGNKNDQQKGKGGQNKVDPVNPVVYMRDVASLPEGMKGALGKQDAQALQDGTKGGAPKQNGTNV